MHLSHYRGARNAALHFRVELDRRSHARLDADLQNKAIFQRALAAARSCAIRLATNSGGENLLTRNLLRENALVLVGRGNFPDRDDVGCRTQVDLVLVLPPFCSNRAIGRGHGVI